MNRPEAETLAVVIARTDRSTADLGDCLTRFAVEAGPIGEILVVDASGDPTTETLAARFPQVRVIRRPLGQLAPLLWREGLLATDAALVAITTAEMVPTLGWLAALQGRLIETGAAGVGGPIEPGPRLSATARAVALLRYANYFPPLPLSNPDRVDPPGDNALYRRDHLMAVGSAWVDGFWEVDVHKALRDRGELLAMAGPAVVTFQGGIGLVSMVRQRLRHAYRYGAGRSKGLGTMARLLRIAACPLVPLLLSARIMRALRARKIPLTPWLRALPGLLAMATAWAIGEAVGIWFGVGDIRRFDCGVPGLLRSVPPPGPPLARGELDSGCDAISRNDTGTFA